MKLSYLYTVLGIAGIVLMLQLLDDLLLFLFIEFFSSRVPIRLLGILKCLAQANCSHEENS